MENKKKITVIVNGRFHAFDYAAELHKLGCLDKLISTMPYSKAKQFGIPRDKYVGFPFLEILKVLSLKIFNRHLPTMLYARFFTKLASFFITNDTDVIISFAGYSKEIFSDKKNFKKIKILDRGSTHTLANIKLKTQAANYHKTFYQSHPKKFVDREIIEYKMADYIMVPSSFVKKTFTNNHVPDDKLFLNPYAFSTTKFPKKSDKVNRELNTILFVGQLSPRKGIKVLVDAFNLLKLKLPEAKLWLVGAINGIDEAIIKKQGIEYFGVLKKDALKHKFESASVFCLPSFEEGLALVLTEAKYFKLPIVATKNTGVEDLFKENEDGYTLYETANPQDLANKLELALKSKYNLVDKKNEDVSWLDFTKTILQKIEAHEKNI
jgi:glycosyltransferase involved in cell wall biosynthesis